MSRPESFSESAWYIVKQRDGHCTIVPSELLETAIAPDSANDPENSASENVETQRWGPFASEGEAIARRVGLIRAGKCQPF